MSADYKIRESERARCARIVVEPDGRVVVTKPKRLSMRELEKWVGEKQEWIEKARAYFKRRHGGIAPTALPRPRRGSKADKEARERARTLVTERLMHFNRLYGFSYGTLSIRNQKTRWGSCSAAGNLSFNYRIAFLPPALADYIIVHELCHTKEHNHSARFWAEVARAIPNHKELRKELRTRYHL